MLHRSHIGFTQGKLRSPSAILSTLHVGERIASVDVLEMLLLEYVSNSFRVLPEYLLLYIDKSPPLTLSLSLP